MHEITLKQFNSIHKDYRGTYGKDKKKSCFVGSLCGVLKILCNENGTNLVIEDLHFRIVG